MPKKISATMAAAIVETKDHGGELVRWSGGFWTYPNCAAAKSWGSANNYRVPVWYVGTNTVLALIARGLVEVTKTMERGDPCAVRLIPET